MTVSEVFPVFNETTGMTGPTPGLSGKTQVLGCGILPTYCLSSLALQLMLLRLRLWLETGTGGVGGWQVGY